LPSRCFWRRERLPVFKDPLKKRTRKGAPVWWWIGIGLSAGIAWILVEGFEVHRWYSLNLGIMIGAFWGAMHMKVTSK